MSEVLSSLRSFPRKRESSPGPLLGPRFRGDERKGAWASHILVLIVLLLSAGPAYAVLPHERLADPALEARARALSTELRCMVCQNQSIDDSDAPLAADLRVLLRERIMAGDSDAEVIDFLVERYGEFILLKPRFGWHTLILWAAPLALFAIAVLVAAYGYRRRHNVAASEPAPLDASEREALQRLVSGGEMERNITEK
jgi:cytochrome c-type biogenesis protein CcmH